MVRIWVLAGLAAVCAVAAASVWFGRAGLAAGLVVVGVICLGLAGTAAKVVADGRS